MTTWGQLSMIAISRSLACIAAARYFHREHPRIRNRQSLSRSGKRLARRGADALDARLGDTVSDLCAIGEAGDADPMSTATHMMISALVIRRRCSDMRGRNSAAAIAEASQRSVGFMLPTPLANDVGDLLRERFQMAQWQVDDHSFSDANRAVIRWARAITKRDKILIFDGCYHGMVDDCFVALKDGVAVNKTGLIGQVIDQTRTTKVIPFNDVAGAG
jgi:hypothetical protein